MRWKVDTLQQGDLKYKTVIPIFPIVINGEARWLWPTKICLIYDPRNKVKFSWWHDLWHVLCWADDPDLEKHKALSEQLPVFKVPFTCDAPATASREVGHA